ncbi:uncharacterized protein ARMOST_20447 [Armillaria ostoyae]|uniref:Heterokaryon incompatibility domain-containing protein n=1 Tax=Armillaria ostoyae TaxID=47428 RepID=A0A284S7D4_ARMOS|nr:uncharacterized protein ARMOST_20447 [Armillaria ostoyae]
MDEESYTDEEELQIYNIKHYEELPEITLSASDGTSHKESSVPVLKQRSFTGRVLPSTTADIPCAVLGIHGMMERLNSPVRTPGSPLYRACEYFVGENYDLGTAYAHLRRYPYNFNIDRHVTARKSDEKRRQDLVEHRKIKNAPPRRVWDLYANRVVPYWVAIKFPWAMSHAWVADTDLKRVMTPINGYEWPVPMPKDADLDLIRIEMLNLGAEYVWLDVLCLRQEGRGEDPRFAISQGEWDQREALRKEEWKVDVPTIGWVYPLSTHVVCYLSGLGLPLSFKTARDFEDDRCWFNRAWTLQEISDDMLIAGKTCNDDSMVASGSRMRKSTKPVDKITGLVCLFDSKHIPIYDASQSEEDAWTELVNVAPEWIRAHLFFLYPKPGNVNKTWRPSWQQVMEETLPNPQRPFAFLPPRVCRTKNDGDSCCGPRIDRCTVRGLADATENSRYGELDINNGRVESTFKIVADHAYAIDDGQYTLIGAQDHFAPSCTVNTWVIGRTEEPKEKFRKVSVIRMADCQEAERFERLRIYRRTETFLF